MENDVYGVLESRIREGRYRPGAWLDTERDLAREMGVHRSTVRRAIVRLVKAGLVEHQPGRRPIVRRPDEAARQPATVALLMGNEPLLHAFQLVLRGCEPELREEGYRLLFMDTWAPTQAASERERAALVSLAEHPVAGLIIWSQDPVASAGPVRAILESGVPIVAIDRLIPGVPTDFVGIDNVQAAQTVVENLLSLGHRRIGFASLQEDSSPVLDRETGYRMALERHGLSPDPRLLTRLPGDDHDPELARWVRSLAAMEDRPTAIFAVNDILALRLLHHLSAVGLRVPEDVAVVGFDDLEANALHTPVLTTIRQPFEGIGRQAVRVLMQRIQCPTMPLRHVILDTQLVERKSTRTEPAGSNGAGPPSLHHLVGAP